MAKPLSGMTALILGAAILAAPRGSLAQALEDVLVDLIHEHPQIKSATKTLATARKEIDKAAAGFLPTVNLANDIGQEYINSPGERATGDDKISSRTKTVSTMTVTQNLFQGYATTSAARTAFLNKMVAQHTLNTVEQDVLLEGATVYIDVLRQNQLVELSTQNEETIQIQLNLEDERVQKGQGIAVDVLQSKSRLQLAKERRIRFSGALEDAVSRFVQVFNKNPDLGTMREPQPSADLVPEDINAAIDIARYEAPGVLTSEFQLAVAKENRRAVKADLFPSLDLVTTMNYEKHNGGTIGTRRDMSVILQSSWDIFTGLTTRANVSQAATDFAASRDNFEFARRKAVEGVRIAWENLRTRRDQFEQLQNAVNIAEEVFDARRKLRAAGKEQLINVLDAESEVTNARINLTSSRFDLRLAVFQLLRAMGRLTVAEITTSAQGAGDTLPR